MMTRQPENQTYDQKKGSADLKAVVNDIEQRDARAGTREGEDDGRIPEQPGCGPNVTDYPGLGQPRGTDAQITGSDT